MKEDFLHYIWKYGLYTGDSLKTKLGQQVQVLQPGYYHSDAGPDFREARICIGSSTWVGHVEIHIKASDWYHHGHHTDPAYNPVILHVVHADDRQAITSSGVPLPTICLDIKTAYYQSYLTLVKTIDPIPCHATWQKLDGIFVEQALCSMGVERLESRFEMLKDKLRHTKGGWKDLFLQTLFRAFGFGKYQDNFDYLAQSLPWQVVEKHKSNLFQLESLLFGQAGLIPSRDPDAYPRALRAEYAYLREKHRLVPNHKIIWRSRRTRPANSPVLRLAQLAAWLHDQSDFFSRILEYGLQTSRISFETFVSSYWKSHYDFGQPAQSIPYGLGEKASELILINAILPLNAFYRQQHGDQQAIVNWMETLEDIPPEYNSIVKLWKEAGFRIPNSFYSQSLLYIFKSYCKDRKCLTCQLGQLIIQK